MVRHGSIYFIEQPSSAALPDGDDTMLPLHPLAIFDQYNTIHSARSVAPQRKDQSSCYQLLFEMFLASQQPSGFAPSAHGLLLHPQASLGIRHRIDRSAVLRHPLCPWRLLSLQPASASTLRHRADICQALLPGQGC